MNTAQHLALAPPTPATDGEVEGRHQVAIVMTLMRALKGVMEVENELLRNLPLDWLRDVQAEKAALVHSYEQALRHLREALIAPGGLGEPERAALDAGIRELAAAVQRNTARLAHARATLDEVGQAIDESLAMMRTGPGLAPRPRLASG